MLYTLLAKKAVTFGEAFTNEFIAGYKGELPKLLTYYPVANMNPFQRILYSASEDSGYMVMPAFTLDDLDSIRWGGRSIIHLHWVGAVLKGVDDFHEGTKKVHAFIERMKQWHGHGHKILWTMHNVLPHDTTNKKLACYFREKMVQHVDAIHIMNKDSVTIAREYYPVPDEKVFHVPHVSFLEWYPNATSRRKSRSELGLEHDAFYFLCIGAISPYKKIKELIEAFTLISPSCPKARLLIAGIPGDKQYASEVSMMGICNKNIIVYPTKLLDSQFQLYLNACDMVVLPYKTLNSGVAIMAHDFKKHCIGPKNSGVSAVFSDGYEFLYDLDQETGLTRMLEKAMTCDLSLVPYPKQHAKPADISKYFFENLNRILL